MEQVFSAIPQHSVPGSLAPTCVLLQARADGTSTVTNALWSLRKRELSRPCGFSVICLGRRVHKDLGVFMFWFLCDHLFVFPSACDLYVFA